MKKLILLLVAFVALVTFTFTACTQNQRARNFGGNMTIKLEAGQKLMMATWKGEDLFYLTEPMEEDYVPKTKTFHENASFGIIETTVKFVETR